MVADGYVAEAWRRTGVLCRSPRVLLAAIPDLLADEPAADAVLKSPLERATIERIAATHPSQEIDTGRRGRRPVVTFDPARVQKAVDFVSRCFGVPVSLVPPA